MWAQPPRRLRVTCSTGPARSVPASPSDVDLLNYGVVRGGEDEPLRLARPLGGNIVAISRPGTPHLPPPLHRRSLGSFPTHNVLEEHCARGDPKLEQPWQPGHQQKHAPRDNPNVLLQSVFNKISRCGPAVGGCDTATPCCEKKKHARGCDPVAITGMSEYDRTGAAAAVCMRARRRR